MAEKTLERSLMDRGGRQRSSGDRRNKGKSSLHTDGRKPSSDFKNKINRTRQRNHAPKPLPKIEMMHFLSNFHSEICQAAKYKVHAPMCTCSKIDWLRLRFQQEKNKNNSKSLSEELKDLDLSDPFDNLLVVPDTKTTPAIFVCNGTSSTEFRDDATRTLSENKLAKEIFDGNSHATSLDSLPFKVSCALCLLRHQKNGFVAVAADSAEALEPTIGKANALKAAIKTDSNELHSDHAHFICAVKLSSLKTRSKHGQIVSEILHQLKSGGVDLPTSADDASWKIQLGHHLTSLLYLGEKLATSKRTQHIMVLGYVDGPTELMLDLPGGKRHLGESTLESLVREVKEETSLQLDKQWLSERLSRRYGGALDETSEDIHALESKKENGNVYFVIPPMN